MKIKILSLILSLILAMMLVFMSCSNEEESSSEPPKDPETPEELWERTEEEMDALDSYKASVTAEIKMAISGIHVDGKITGTLISIDHESSPYFYEETVTELKNEVFGINQKMTGIEAYRNGIRFLKYDDGKTVNKLCAEFDKVDFEKYLEKKVGKGALNPTECVYLDFSKNEDGTWTLTGSGFPKKAINNFVSDKFDDLGSEVEDIEITLTMNEDFLLIKEEFSLVFEDEDSKIPSVLYVCDYSEFNDAERIIETINPDEYIKIDSDGFKILDSLEEQIEEHQNSKNGKLDLLAYQEVSITGGSKNTSVERDQITYGVKNGSYFYEILADVNGTELKMVYEDGEVTTTPSGLVPSQKISDEEAKQNIADLINSANFLKPFATSVTKNEDGTWTIVQKVVDGDKYENMVKSIAQGYTHRYDGATQKITLTLDGDKITEIKSVIEIKGSVMINASNIKYIRINIGSTVEFLDPNADGANGTTNAGSASV